MAVIAKKTELKCKLCAHEERAWIDSLLERRSNGEKDEDGYRINADYVLERLRELGVQNPTLDNIKGHWKNHCEKVSDEVAEAQQLARRRVVEESEAAPADVDAVLDKIIRLGEADLDARVEVSGVSGVTVDQMLKAAQVKSQRRTDEATRQLLGATAVAIGSAFGGKPLKPADDIPAIEAEVIEEGELVG